MSTATQATQHRGSHGHGAHGAAVAPVASGELARAVTFEAPRTLGFRDVSLRVVASDEVLVATRYSSISAGTEKLLYNGKLPGFPALRYPLVPGYESVGVVEQIGAEAGADGIALGDEVFVGGSMCYTDAAGVFGGNASRLIKKAALVVPLRGIAMERAPLLALAATALHGVRRLGDVRGKRVLVLGVGAIGHYAARFLVRAGATPIAVDRSAARLATLGDLSGVEAHLAPGDREGDAALLASLGALDAAIEATGDPEQIAACARTLVQGGSVLLLSYYDRIATDYVDLFVKEASLLVAREWAHDDLLETRDAVAAGEIDLAPLDPLILPIEEYGRAYATAFDNPAVSKVILQWA